MSKAAFSLRTYAIYLFALGSALVFYPNLLLTSFGFPATNEVWIRVVGVLALLIAYLDFMASSHELEVYFLWTVSGRFSVLGFFIGFVVLGFASPVLILFGLIDAATAIWTARCLRLDKLAHGFRRLP